MPLTPSDAERPPTGADRRLDSWKEIASYLRREVRTAQRWEKSEELPVHRHRHGRRDTVYAFRAEIDAWLARRTRAVVAQNASSPAPAVPDVVPDEVPRSPQRRPSARWIAVGILGAVVVGGLALGLPPGLLQGSPATGDSSSALLTLSPGRDAYERGRYLWHKGTVDGFRSSLALFEEALVLDRDLVEARAGLASAHALLGRYGAAPGSEAFPRAREIALLALESDPLSAEAHVAAAMVRFYFDRDFAGAAESFRSALDCGPQEAFVHHAYAHFLSCLGLHGSATAAAERARELEPLWSLVVVDSAWLRFRARDYHGAIAESRRALELEPGHESAVRCLVESLLRLDRPETAWAEWESHLRSVGTLSKISDLDGASPSECITRVGAWYGARLEHAAQSRYVSPHARVFALVAMERDTEALDVLEAAFESRDRVVLLTQVHPAFDRLRDRPRFRALIERIGFPADPESIL